jgi:hypothetical protein
MSGNGKHNGAAGPHIAIPGAAGEAIALALARMATHPGELVLTIIKRRVAGGGYVYTLANQQAPMAPLTER